MHNRFHNPDGLVFEKGGGGGDLPPVTSAPLPITQSSREFKQAGRDLKKQQQKRRGFASTVYAGENNQPSILQGLGG